jgi:YcxB-like protein
MEVRFDLLPEDLKALKRYVDRHPGRSQWLEGIVLVVFFVFHFAVVPFGALLLSGRAPHLAATVWAIVIGQLVCWVIFFVFVQILAPKAKLLMGHDKAVGLTIAPDSLRVVTPLSECAHRWTDIEKLAVAQRHVFFFIEPRKAYVVPRRAFVDDDSYYQFLERARSYFEAANAFADEAYGAVT